MKKTALLHGALSQLIASLGHGERIVIADAGLPLPPGVPLIDLALTQGVPGLMVTLQTVLSEMQVEQYVVAAELQLHHPQLAQQIAATDLGQALTVPHAEFKRMTAGAKAMIRTGEFTAYANLILVAGVVF